MPAGTRMTAAHSLRQPLERLYREFDYSARVELDAIRFPLRYGDPRDREIVALLSACLAYGRVDLFGRALQGVLASMGSSPAAFVTEFEPCRDGAAFKDFWYRFNRPHDLVAFCIAARDLLARFGTLEKCFAAGDEARSASIDPADPVKFDFALCHKRMSGDCLDRRDTVVCAPCGFKGVCRHWRATRRRA